MDGPFKISKISKIKITLMYRTQSLWLPWFPAKNNTCINIWNTVYVDENSRAILVLIWQLRYQQPYFDKFHTKIRNTMKCNSSNIILLLKTLIFICLAIVFFIFYFSDVIHKFAERNTTLILSSETIEENVAEPPLITFCIQPRVKKTILEG